MVDFAPDNAEGHIVHGLDVGHLALEQAPGHREVHLQIVHLQNHLLFGLGLGLLGDPLIQQFPHLRAGGQLHRGGLNLFLNHQGASFTAASIWKQAQ